MLERKGYPFQAEYEVTDSVSELWVRMRAQALGYIPWRRPGPGNAFVAHRSIPLRLVFVALAKTASADGRAPRFVRELDIRCPGKSHVASAAESRPGRR
jgi:hypothetical protein